MNVKLLQDLYMPMTSKQHIHFIGIGGIGMSGLARYYLHEGWQVSGSDRDETDITRALAAEGVELYAEQVATNISESIDQVVYTEAMPKDHPEMQAAQALDIPMLNYFQALGQVANQYYLIAVAGTHGKTTTTAMLADILEEASYDPTVIVGSLRAKTGSNFRPGQSKYAVVEACEYKRDFLHLTPDVLVITNIELEHVDYYKDLADVQSAFRELAQSIPEEGYIVTDTASETIAPCLEGVQATVIDYREHLNLTMSLRQPGLHIRLDAAAASAAATTIGIEKTFIEDGLTNFAGTWRRFEYKGDIVAEGGGLVPVYDDYGHHPTEIRVTLDGVRELYPDKTIQLVFQSHTYSRTKDLFAEFVEVLALADSVTLLPIYAARSETESVSSEDIMAALAEKQVPTKLLHTPEAAAVHIRETVRDGDVVVVMGAGPVTEVANQLAG